MCTKTMSPRHWFQIADETAIVTVLESDNQLLLNLFTKWANWAGLTIQVEKRPTFGMRKTRTESKQYNPTLLVNCKSSEIEQGCWRNLTSADV